MASTATHQVNAMISGKRAIALLVDEHSVRSMHYDDPDTIVDRRAEDLPYLLGNTSDVEFLEDSSLEEVKTRLDHAVNREEARDLLVILFDGEVPDDIRKDAAGELDELLAQPAVLDAVERIFFSIPVPQDGDLVGALACCLRGSVCHKFLQDLLSSQAAIRNVKGAWDRVSREVFETITDREVAEGLCVREGLFRDFVRVGDPAEQRGVIHDATLRSAELLKYFTLETIQELATKWSSLQMQWPVEDEMRQNVESETNANRLLSFLEFLEKSKSSFVAAILLKICQDGRSIDVQEHLKLDKEKKEDLLLADSCIQSANSTSQDTVNQDDALKAFVIIGKFLATVLRESPDSLRLISDGLIAVLAAAKLELTVSLSEYPEIVDLFFHLEEDELFLELRKLLVRLNVSDLTRVAEG